MRVKIVQEIIDKLRNKKRKIERKTIEPTIYSAPYKKPNSTYKKLICPTGFGHSGSGTLLDYFSEFSNTTVLGFFDPNCSFHHKKSKTGTSYPVGQNVPGRTGYPLGEPANHTAWYIPASLCVS